VAKKANFILLIATPDGEMWTELPVGPYESTAKALTGLRTSTITGRVRVARITAEKDVKATTITKVVLSDVVKRGESAPKKE